VIVVKSQEKPQRNSSNKMCY